jgi:hypothetical protein
MSFSGSYTTETIKTDLIVFSNGRSGEIYHSYIESYFERTGRVVGGKTLANNPFLGNGGDLNYGSYLDAVSLSLYLTSTSLAFNEAKDTYSLANTYRNSPRTKLQKAFPGYFKGGSKALKNSQKALNVTKAVGRSLSRPFFFASVGVSAVNVAMDPTFNNIAWNVADIGVGAAGLIFAATPAGWVVGAGAAIYFTGRMAYDVYDAYNNDN